MIGRLDIFLLIGQSNMAGRGRIDEVQPLRDPHVLMYRQDRWTTAEEPLHTDKPDIAGIGLGMSFAFDLLARSPGMPIGLVPCAFGGTPLSRWMPGADLYETAISITRRALARGRLRGVLWHQGENDANDPGTASSYGSRFVAMVKALRSALGEERAPVVAGELGTFLQGNSSCKHFEVVNRQLREAERILPVYGCVTSDGLTDKGDILHFDSASLRELGRRYASRYVALAAKVGADEPAPRQWP